MRSLRQREPRVTDAAFLAFLRLKPCKACRAPPPVQAAHIRGADLIFRKRDTGKGETPSDRWALPLCGRCHLNGPRALHRIGEKQFFAAHGIDPCACAAVLYDEFCESRPPRKPRRARAPRRKNIRQLKPNFKPQKIRSRPFPKGRKIGGRR